LTQLEVETKDGPVDRLLAINTDERRLENMVRLLPTALVYQYDGWDGDYVRLTFRPAPAFATPTMESKALQSMAWVLI
jgi:hypothetical protein